MTTKAGTKLHLGVSPSLNLSPELTNRTFIVKPPHSQGQVPVPPWYINIFLSLSLEPQLPIKVTALFLLTPIRITLSQGLEVASCPLLSTFRANNQQMFLPWVQCDIRERTKRDMSHFVFFQFRFQSIFVLFLLYHLFISLVCLK